MARWACKACGSLWAPGAPCCPDCRSAGHLEEEEPVKITNSGVSAGPGDFRPNGHPGTGEPMTGIEHPADGTMSPEVGNDGDGEQVVQLPPGEFAEPDGPALYMVNEGEVPHGPEGLEVLKAPAEGAEAEAPAVRTPPRTPPRRSPAGGGGGA